jgi:hypothetical protein
MVMPPEENLLQALSTGQEATIRQALELNLTLTGEAPVEALTRLAMARDQEDWANDQSILQIWEEEWFCNWGTSQLLRHWVAACIRRILPHLEEWERVVLDRAAQVLEEADYPGIMTHGDRRELRETTAPLSYGARRYVREAVGALRLRAFVKEAPKYLVRLHPDPLTAREWQVRDLMGRLLAHQ